MLAACGAPAPAAPVAPACGDVVIGDQADVARAAGCVALRSLTIRSGAALDLAPLAGLREVTGDVVVGPTVGMEDLSLTGLRTVGGALRVVGNGLAQGIFLRQLERAGAITIDGNPAITTIALPRLTTAAALRVTDNASLELLDLAALTTLGAALVVTGAPRLSVLDAPGLPDDQRAALP
ncbi:MAG TPA: hypothetical protein VFP84_27245 [Kofleriaceae bacterium]|nr:hypothetical protein [Kofleriaceae bacterium]